jgi:hypothetical protein
MEAKDAIARVQHAARLIHEDLSIAKAIKAGGNPHSRAERMGALATTYRAHRDSLLSTVADFLEPATLEICGEE